VLRAAARPLLTSFRLLEAFPSALNRDNPALHMPPGGNAYKLGGNYTWRKEVSGQNGKVTGMVAENPASGVKLASDSDEVVEIDVPIDAEITAVQCIKDAFPVAIAEPCADEWAYDVHVKGEYVGTVYLVDQYSRRALSVEEICAQVKDIKNKFAQKGDQA